VLLVSLIVLFLGLAFLAISTMSFWLRAIANKPAWGGLTLKALIIGLILGLTGLVMVYFNYPQN
jgi:hypothetical protein